MKRLPTILAAVSAAALVLTGQLPDGARLPAWSVAGHAVGRALVTPGGSIETFGYFTQIDGYPESVLFLGAPSEQNARFTFRSDRARIFSLANNGVFLLRLIPLAEESTVYRVYFDTSPDQDFNRPQTFSDSPVIATFAVRGGSLTVVPGALSTYTAVMDLTSSHPVVFGGVSVDARLLVDAIRVSLTGPALAEPREGNIASIPFAGAVYAVRK